MTAFNDPSSCKYWPHDGQGLLNPWKKAACYIVAPNPRTCDCPKEFVAEYGYGECPDKWKIDGVEHTCEE